MNKERMGKIGASAAAFVFAAAAGAELLPDNTADASAANTRTVSCRKVDAWYPLKPDQTLVVKARAVVVPADVEVNNVAQYDNEADTSTVVGIFSKDKRTSRITNKWGGSAHVLACRTSRRKFYADLGRQAAILDARVQKNNPDKRVNLNVIFK